MFGELTTPEVVPTELISLVAALIDESGSMTGVRAETIGGYNSFVKTIGEEQVGKKAFVSTFLFDGDGIPPIMRTLQDAVPIEGAAFLSLETYNPRGGTPLYDAIGLAVRAIDTAAARTGANKITFLIQTDGGENQSREFSHKAVKTVIEEKIKDGWQIVFLGADLKDAHAVGIGLGVSANNSMKYAKSASAQTFSTMASSTAAYRGTGGASADVNLTKEQKKSIGANS